MIGLGKPPKPVLGYEPDAELEEAGDVEEEKEARVVKPTTINLFQHPDAHPLILDLALLRKYGPEWMTWETDTLEWRIPQDFRTTTVSDLNLDKIEAVKTMHFVDTFWQRWEVFIWCCMPLNDVFPDFGIMQVPTAAQCLVAADIANKIRDDVPWSDEIKGYLDVVFRHDGIFCSLPPLDFVDVEIPQVVDCEEIKERWDEVRKTNSAPTKNTIVDEQLRRLLVIQQYLTENRERYTNQTGLLDNV